MNPSPLTRLFAGQVHPLAIGVASFATTLLLILSQPGSGIA
jgi:hypothetical protein